MIWLVLSYMMGVALTLVGMGYMGEDDCDGAFAISLFWFIFVPLGLLLVALKGLNELGFWIRKKLHG